MSMLPRAKRYAQLVVASTIALWISQPGCCGTKALVLSQWEEIAGDHDVIVTADAVRMYSKKSQSTMIAKAPTWKVYFFNTEKKIMLEAEAAKWHCPFGLIVGAVANARFKSCNMPDLGPAKVAGLAAKKLRATAQAEVTKHGQFMGNKETPAFYYVADSKPKFPKELCHILQLSFGMPLTDGLPLMMDIQEKGWGKIMVTNNCHEENVDKKIFDVPTNYRKARSDSEIVFGSSQGLIEDFVPSLEESKSSHKH